MNWAKRPITIGCPRGWRCNFHLPTAGLLCFLFIATSCGSASAGLGSASPQQSVSPELSPQATPDGRNCTPMTEPLPGLCVGRSATPQEEAAMIAVGRPAIEAAFNLADWSVCSGTSACFKIGDPPRGMVGTRAGTLFGQEGQGPGVGCSSPCYGSGCWIFLAQDTTSWHYVDAVCTQDSGYLPSLNSHVFASGCADAHAQATIESKVMACVPGGSVVSVDRGPVYADGQLWWHLAGQGWMTHQYLVNPALTGNK
jgi:hypothetical protein